MPEKADAIEIIFKLGLEAFNQQNFYEAHEHFESAWQRTADSSREYYRALLHLSGGFFRLTQNRPLAAKKFFTRAHFWLDKFPDNHLDLDNRTIKDRLKEMIAALDETVDGVKFIEQYHFPLHG